jgi:hypothetical protein
MGVLETAIIYGLIGLVVATALVLRPDEEATAVRKVGLFLLSSCFWPLYAPSLLGGSGRVGRGRGPAGRAGAEGLSERMQRAQAQVLAALDTAEGVAQAVAPDVARVRLLTGSVAAMERRVREIDELLSTEELDLGAAKEALAGLERRGVPETDPRHQSVSARVKNIERLAAIRDRTVDDLERIAFKLEEMSSRLRLLRFAGKPDAEVVQLFKEVADSVEEVSEGLLAAS